jgi:hypothetical protein
LVIVNAGCAERTRGREPASPGVVNAGFAGEIGDREPASPGFVKGEPAFGRDS